MIFAGAGNENPAVGTAGFDCPGRADKRFSLPDASCLRLLGESEDEGGEGGEIRHCPHMVPR
ncbi:hypothetical protein, partial [Stenotrophomonas maltophilia]|uniref:hypothetical protein n=1 Tax=Stenotrophomonas maltophilia TaxID=40324 RepID=UPI0019530967